MDDYTIRASTSGLIRKDEFNRGTQASIDIINSIPLEVLQGNKDLITLVADDGEVIAVYFNVGVVFDDLEYLYDNVKLVSLKYVKSTGAHYYKYYVTFNPLEVPIANIVSTGFFSNDPTKITVYTVPHLYDTEEENTGFVLSEFQGTTLDANTLEIIQETTYAPNPNAP